MPEIKLSSLASNGYNTELIRLLAQYGALGSNGSALADAVLEIVIQHLMLHLD